MRCHGGKQLETFEEFMQSEQYREIDRLMVRDKDITLLKRGAKGRRQLERPLGREGHSKGLRQMVIVKSLRWRLQEHTVAPDVMAYRLLRHVVKHLQERMLCRDAQFEVRAEDILDPVTKRIEIALIRYSLQVTTMEVQLKPDWRLRQTEDAGEEAGQAVDEQRERLMARRRKRMRQVWEP